MFNSDDQPTELGPAAFLDLMHGRDAKIYFQVGGKTWKQKPQTFRQAESTLRWRNAEGDDIGFVVNSGGTTNQSITKVNAFWIDWDAGRDGNGHYLPTDVVMEQKREFRSTLLDAFQPAPSVIVETRNGYQCYWLAVPDVPLDMFVSVQDRLCSYFRSDSGVNRLCNVLRLPGFDWVKKASGLPRYSVKVVQFTNQRFTADTLLTALPAAESGDSPDSAKEPPVAFKHHNKCTVKTTALIVVSKRPQGESTSFSTMDEIIDYLKRLNLPQHLGLKIHPSGKPQRIACPFHSDTNPSATISCDPATGYWLFCCHSGNCQIAGTLIDLTMRSINTTEPGKAIGHLMQQYHLSLESGWRERQRAVLQGNVDRLSDTERLAEQYPQLYRWVRGVLPHLRGILRLAGEFVVSERLQHEGLPIFFISLRELERRLRAHDATHFGRQSRFIDRYCLLGLLRKLPDAAIPEVILRQARQHQRQGRMYRIQFYQFPEYTDAILRRANERARDLIAAGASVQGVSRQMIRDLFGDNVASEVYPQSVRR